MYILQAILLATPHLCLTLQADLAAKYVDIFRKYGLDLEEVQKLYEKHKHAPPVVRNAPPVAGNIMWARQLLRRIEMPMTRSVLACSTFDLLTVYYIARKQSSNALLLGIIRIVSFLAFHARFGRCNVWHTGLPRTRR